MTSAILRILAASVMFGAVVTGQAFAQADPNSAMANLKLSNNEPIQIESDNLEVDEQNSKATFLGNVNVVQGQTNLKAGKMVVFYKKPEKGAAPASGSSQIDRLEVSDKVYVKSGTQIATGDRGNFDMNSNILTLTGSKVVLSDGPNVLTGCKLTVLTNSGKANVDGCSTPAQGKRVKILLNPSSAKK